MPPSYSKKKGFTSAGTQRFQPDPKKYLYNIDTLWLNVDSYHYDAIMDYELRELLIEGRTARQDDGDDEYFVECIVEGYENPILFEVMGGNPPLYQYSLRNDSMAIYFSKSKRSGQLPMRVQINQFPLWEKGLEGAYFEAMQVLASLGFMVSEVRINRVDFAVHSDQFTWNFSDMATFTYPKNIKDDNKPNYYKLDATDLSFGTMMVGDRSRLAIRIYNKSKEIEDKKKFYFYDLYRSHGMDINNIWNIEIECRRPFLKELCEDNEELTKIFDDFNYCLANDGLSRLWSILMQKYNHDSAHWRMLHKLDKHFMFTNVHGLTVHKDKNASFEREIPQILGRLAQAVVTEEDYSLENAIEILKSKLPEYEEKRAKKGKRVITFEERVEVKKSLIQNNDINETLSPVKVEITKDEQMERLWLAYQENNRSLEDIQNSNANLSPKEIKQRYLNKIEQQKNSPIN